MTVCQAKAIFVTGDGSHSLELAGTDVTYHSRHGAIQESRHVFIEAGLRATQSSNPLRILEMGFGTGLNAFLTFLEGVPVYYHAIELFPLSHEDAMLLNYPELLGNRDLFLALHGAPWEEAVPIGSSNRLQKSNISLLEFATEEQFDVIYFDAFAPDVQPELWTAGVFRRLHELLKPGGIWVSYCSKSDVRRRLLEAGYAVEKLPGPPGKREMLRAKRP